MAVKINLNYTALNYIKLLFLINYIESLALAFAVTECVAVSALASLVDIPIGIVSSGSGLKVCSIIPGIKKYQSSRKTMIE